VTVSATERWTIRPLVPQTEGTPVEAAIKLGGVLSRLDHGRLQLAGVDAAEIDGLVDIELALHADDPVLAGLGQVKAGAAGGPQFGDHVLVVGEGDLHIDTGFFLKLGHHIIGGIATPGYQPQLFSKQAAGKSDSSEEGGAKQCGCPCGARSHDLCIS